MVGHSTLKQAANKIRLALGLRDALQAAGKAVPSEDELVATAEHALASAT